VEFLTRKYSEEDYIFRTPGLVQFHNTGETIMVSSREIRHYGEIN